MSRYVLRCKDFPFIQDTSFITVVPGILVGIALTMAKKEMVEFGLLVQNSGLEWTIVRFMAPKDTDYTGKIKVGFGNVKMNFNISCEDIAAFMANPVESDNYLYAFIQRELHAGLGLH